MDKNDHIWQFYESDHEPHLTVVKQFHVTETYPIHTHNFDEFFLVTKGRARHIVNSTTFIVERGSLVFIRSEDIHFYDIFQDDHFVMYNVGIPGVSRRIVQTVNEDVYAGLKRRPLPKHILLDDEMTLLLEKYLIQLQRESVGRERSILFHMLLMMVVHLICTGKERQPNEYMPDWLFKLIERMEERQNFVVGLPRLLELANYSQEHVNRTFKQYLNTTPTRFINEKRLSFARRLLASTDMTVANVSTSCGFNNLSHFYEQYKKMFNGTPGDEIVKAPNEVGTD
ncbi:MAG: AraC family transcriptional regulator [Clostridiales bacterium]|jgi:AraC family cel operon transcriptional repressor|nr:AraC family transcriptional regulator [Clostridiales bacterium]